MAKSKGGLAALTAVFMTVSAQVSPVVSEYVLESEDFPACFDEAGQAIPYVTSDFYMENAQGQKHIVSYAGALYMKESPPSVPAIIYNPNFIKKLNVMERVFVFSHECHHLTSGDSRRAYLALQGNVAGDVNMRSIEDNADCAAAVRMRDEFDATYDDMVALQPMIRSVTSDRREEMRLEHIMACYTP